MNKPLLRSARTIPGLVVLLTVSILMGSNLAAQEELSVLDEIVAKVNNEIITLTDLNKELRNLRGALGQDISDPTALDQQFNARKRMILRGMIQNRIMVQRAEELGVTADIDLDVSAYLEELRRESGAPSLDVLDQYLRQQGTSLSEYRQSVKEQMIQRNLLQQFVYSKITLLTPEVEAYYQENASRFTEPAEVDLAEILFLTEGKDKATVRARAEEVLNSLNSGQSFEDLAKEYSEGPTADRGGVIGNFSKGSMNESLEAVVFTQEVGTTSGIIEAEYGFQIVKIISRQDSVVKPLNEVRPQIAEALYQKKAEPEVEEFLKTLIDESYIFVTPSYAEEYDLEGLL